MTKEELKAIVREAVTEALTVEITIEKVRNDETGQPNAVIKRKTEKVFLPSLMVQMLPFYEGSMRGFQQDLSRTKKSLDSANSFIKRLADAVERQAEQRLIDYESND